MKLLSLNKKTVLSIILFIFLTPVFSEDSVDIWKKVNSDKKNKTTKSDIISVEKTETKIKINTKLQKKSKLIQMT